MGLAVTADEYVFQAEFPTSLQLSRFPVALLSLEQWLTYGFPCLPSNQWNTCSKVSVLVWTNSFSKSFFSIQSGLRISSLFAANLDGIGSESEL